MKILVTTFSDDNVKIGTEVMLKSLKKHYKGDFDIKIYDSNDARECEFLDNKRNDHRGRVISLERLKVLKNEGDYDRIIMIDSDMLIRNDRVSLLFSDELNEFPVWFTRDWACPFYYSKFMNDLPKEAFVHGGLQVWNKPFLGKEFHDKLIEEFRTLNSADGSDQGYLSSWLWKNRILFGRLQTDFAYSFQDHHYPVCSDPVIVHFTGDKPWKVNNGGFFEEWRMVKDE